MTSDSLVSALVTSFAALCALVQPPAPATRAGDSIPGELCGRWRAVLASPGGELPFELVLAPEAPCARVLNGAEQIGVPEARFADGELVLAFPDYDSRIRARFVPAGQRFEGTWTKRTSKEKPCELAFRATRGAAPRFTPERAAPANTPSSVAGRWSAKFASDPQPAVAVFEQNGTAVTGTFLTTTGDYRYLAGSCEDGRLRLSCFDGAHAFLFDARLEDGALTGTFHSGDAWKDTWTATRDDKASLADTWKLTQPATNVPLGLLSYPDLDGNVRTLAEFVVDSRATLLVLFGSWCPNCHDEMQDLVELDAEFRGKGLTIVGLAFEYTGDFTRDAEQARRALARHGAKYPALLAGRSDRALASQAFPLVDEIRGFPTTLFVDRAGRVRAVHTGYSGPSTGAAHTALVAEFRTRVSELLAEPDTVDEALKQRLCATRWLDQPNAFLTTIYASGDVLQCQSDDPEIELRPEQRTLHPVRLRGPLVAFDHGPIYHFDKLSPALLDPFDFGHRLGGELPNNKPVPEPAYPITPAFIANALRAAEPYMRRDALFSAVQHARVGALIAPIDPTPLLADPDVLVRCQAAWAAGELRTQGAIGALVKASRDGFAPLRRECAHALGRLKAVSAKETLETLARDHDPLVRAHARTALAGLGG